MVAKVFVTEGRVLKPEVVCFIFILDMKTHRVLFLEDISVETRAMAI